MGGKDDAEDYLDDSADTMRKESEKVQQMLKDGLPPEVEKGLKELEAMPIVAEEPDDDLEG